MFSGDALDRHITGNYGEDQSPVDEDDRSMDKAYAAVGEPREDWDWGQTEDEILVKWWIDASDQARQAERMAKWWANKRASIAEEMERRHPQDAYRRLTEKEERA